MKKRSMGGLFRKQYITILIQHCWLVNSVKASLCNSFKCRVLCVFYSISTQVARSSREVLYFYTSVFLNRPNCSPLFPFLTFLHAIELYYDAHLTNFNDLFKLLYLLYFHEDLGQSSPYYPLVTRSSPTISREEYICRFQACKW